ncbi:MAG: hypothetical protein A2785_02300 [Candidatus Chisholmbacteria bacterium RIFCSPHIGHO2_01_FULL_49_18]|uniref:Glycosyltransferase subfamily 4-like N-terminal domain-containing protein n=2 Tax=Candidatus Chisholmiibacteriota TaxID=1817900 RepID=A0A1G1VNM2_9BACT|nr:MAG: hypothetical protein A2785_02300 [Candidatus Chisholmbacteria bacterium RIFCSPHIGHO2_01_FULL_49_18]OGY21549.1 MAG: hypothetical protein A3A65_05515 [Candidatus Chisholmbacteria bacterium RIFCSPLOWO2_01_FULL_49_14]
MRIIVLTKIINRKSGSRAPLEIAKGLRSAGNFVTIIADAARIEPEAVSDLRRAQVKVKFARLHGLGKVLEVFKLIRREKPDLISFHATPSYFLIALLTRIPIVLTYYGTQFDPFLEKIFPRHPSQSLLLINTMLNLAIRVIEFALLRASHRILAISRYTQSELKNLYGVTADYVYLGAPPTTFSRRYSERSLSPKPDNRKPITILSVSRLTPYKGFHTLIGIFNRLTKSQPRLRLTIAGSSPDPRYLRYLKRMQSSKVRLETDVSEMELKRLYRKADIYATLDRYPFFGMPLVEAAGFGVPAVALDACAAAEVVKHGKTGFLAKTPQEFHNYLKRLIENPKLRDVQGRRAKLFSRRFRWDTLAASYTPIFRKVLTQAQKKSWLQRIFFLTTLAAFLRLGFISKHPFWFDEAFSVWIAQLPLPALITRLALDTTPPFYYLLLKAWLSLSHEIRFIRVLSALFGILSVPVAAAVFRKLTSPRVAGFATLLVVLSPLLIYFSTETRMYELLVLEALLAVWLFLRYLQTRKMPYLAALSFIQLLSLLTHYYAFFWVLTVNLVWLLRRKTSRLSSSAWLSSQLVCLIVFLPWVVYALRNTHTPCWCVHPAIGIPVLFASFSVGGLGLTTLKDILTSAPLPIQATAVFAALLTSLIFLVQSLRAFVSRRQRWLFPMIWFWTPVLSASAVGFVFPIFSPRSLIFTAPFFYLGLSQGLAAYGRKASGWGKLLILLVFIAIVALQYFHPFFSTAPPAKANLIYDTVDPEVLDDALRQILLY